VQRLGTLLLGVAILPLTSCVVPVGYASDEPAWGHGYGPPVYVRVRVPAWHPPSHVAPSHVAPVHAGTPPAFHREAPPRAPAAAAAPVARPVPAAARPASPPRREPPRKSERGA